MSHTRSIETKRRLNNLYRQTKYAYGAGAYFDEKKNRLIKYSVNNKTIKLICRRTTRRHIANDDNTMRGGYRKYYDYWWEIT